MVLVIVGTSRCGLSPLWDKAYDIAVNGEPAISSGFPCHLSGAPTVAQTERK
jgi:hypothetical protein